MIYPVGPPRIVQNLEIAPVYFQPIDLEGALMQSADGADIHLEVDIHAAQDNPGGYAQGDWRPYLNVTYRLTKIATGQTLSGTLMPLVSYGGKAGAAAGKPHYGDNLKLLGPGKYHLDLSIAPPDQAQAGNSTPLSRRSRSTTSSSMPASAKEGLIDAGTDPTPE